MAYDLFFHSDTDVEKKGLEDEISRLKAEIEELKKQMQSLEEQLL